MTYRTFRLKLNGHFECKIGRHLAKKPTLLPQVSFRHFTIQFIVPNLLEINKSREGGRVRQLPDVPIVDLKPYLSFGMF